MEAYAPVTRLSQQYFKPHLSVITRKEGGEKVRVSENAGDGPETAFRNERAG